MMKPNWNEVDHLALIRNNDSNLILMMVKMRKKHMKFNTLIHWKSISMRLKTAFCQHIQTPRILKMTLYLKTILECGVRCAEKSEKMKKVNEIYNHFLNIFVDNRAIFVSISYKSKKWVNLNEFAHF